MSLLVLGINHQTAPVGLREAALTGDAELARAADKLFPPLQPGDDDAADNQSGDADA